MYKTFYEIRLNRLFYYSIKRKTTMADAAKSFDRLQEKTYKYVDRDTLKTIKDIYDGA